MASLVVRGLDDGVRDRLARQAQASGRSMEAQVRDILTRAVSQPNIAMALMEAAQSVGGTELDLPPRDDQARSVDFG